MLSVGNLVTASHLKAFINNITPELNNLFRWETPLMCDFAMADDRVVLSNNVNKYV
jgi:hypothetical protein